MMNPALSGTILIDGKATALFTAVSIALLKKAILYHRHINRMILAAIAHFRTNPYGHPITL
jgi:uncharacterized membrane protein